MGSKRKILVFLAVIVGGGLALLAWYAPLLIEYTDILIEHVFFVMEENIYLIPFVGFDALIKNFWISLLLALAGIPLTFILVKNKKALKSSMLIIFWFAVPFILSQLFIFGIYLPYNRFIYFFATPIAILAGVTVYSITKSVGSLESKVNPKITKKSSTLNITKISAITLIFSLFLIQALLFIQITEAYPQFYERASIPSYNSGLWVRQNSVPDGTVITTRSPGSWFFIFSDHQTIQETDPLSSRNAIAEAVLYSFYEIENSLTLSREFDPISPSAGQAIYVSRFNIWTKVLNVPNNQVNVNYVNTLDEKMTIPLSETVENIHWTINSNDKIQLVSKYVHKHFTVKKIVTLSSSSAMINIEWNIEAHQNLANVKLGIETFFDPSRDFKEALVPRVLEWQNPWDNATFINTNKQWALVQGSNILYENLVAILDTENNILTAFQFDESPNWFILGALNNRFIDALNLQYELGDLAEGENQEISFSILVYAFEQDEIEPWTTSDLKQQFDSKTNLPVQGRDFRTYIEEYNIKFVAVDIQQVVSNIEATPALDKIYNNGRVIIYATKR